MWKTENYKKVFFKQICSEVSVNSLGNPCSSREEMKGCDGKDLEKRKDFSLE